MCSLPTAPQTPCQHPGLCGLTVTFPMLVLLKALLALVLAGSLHSHLIPNLPCADLSGTPICTELPGEAKGSRASAPKVNS